MDGIYMPKGASYIINTLYDNGHEAFIVGGCVRDALLSKTADDYDITTSARPEEIKRLFDKTIDTGIEHGTVTVISHGKPYEVTTYRIDGDYADMRHPSDVVYTSNLKDDLSRRDFTVNAMAYNERVGLVDKFFGASDIEKRIIRTVGDPEKRFNEDALRILRGIRFSSALGFAIEENTSAAIKKLAHNLTAVSAERIFAEWKKLISGENAYNVIMEYSEQIKLFIPEFEQPLLPKKESFMALNPLERMLSLFVFNGKAQAFESFAKRLKSDSKTRTIGISVLNNLLYKESTDELDIKLFMIENNDAVSLSSAALSEAFELCPVGTKRMVEELIKRDIPRTLSSLDIDGNDLIKLGISGKNVGITLNELLVAVIKGKVDNSKDALIPYVQNRI